MYETISNMCDLRELTNAVDSAGLQEAVATLDPITLFGPTNEAFCNFTPGETCGELTDILLYHVVPAAVMSGDLVNDTLVPTAREGAMVRTNVYNCPTFNDVITINGAEVVKADIEATNGVLHKINKVLCPPAGTILDLAVGNPDFSILVQAVLAADPAVAEALGNPDLSLTLFAPNNAAFVSLLEETGLTLEEVLALPNLTNILLYHVLGLSLGTVFSAAIKYCSTPNVPTFLEGKTIDLFRDCCDDIQITDQLNRVSNVVGADVLASNGVVHVIDKVILPENC